MNWVEVGAILAVLVPPTVYYMNRIDKRFDKMDARFEKLENKMDNKFEEVRNDIHLVSDRVSRIEGQLTRPQIIPLEKHDDLKEN